MTRPLATNAGLRNQAQEVFGEQAKELGRIRVLDGEAIIHRYTEGTDSGGAPKNTYTPDAEPVEAHRTPIRGESGGLEAAQINESATHRIFVRTEVGLSSNDRIFMDGSLWHVLAIPSWNNPVLTMAEVKRGPT